MLRIACSMHLSQRALLRIPRRCTQQDLRTVRQQVLPYFPQATIVKSTAGRNRAGAHLLLQSIVYNAISMARVIGKTPPNGVAIVYISVDATSLWKASSTEAVPRTPWLGYGIQPVSGQLTPCTEGKMPVDARCEPCGSVFRAVKPRIGNRCTASGDLYIRMSGINRVSFSYCFCQFLRFRSDIHCFDSWRLARDFSVTASLTVIYRYFSANRDEDSKVFRNFIDASDIFYILHSQP